MASAQKQLLDALQTVLATGGTVAASRVYVDRVDTLQSADMPAVLIDEMGESVQPFTISGIDARTLTVQAKCVLAHSSTAAADAREFALAVEKLIANSTTLAALASQGVRLQNTRPSADGEVDRIYCARTQTWDLSYLARGATPDTIF